MNLQQALELNNQAPDGGLLTRWELRWVDQDQAEVRIPALIGDVGDAAEVADVLAHRGTPLLLSDGEDIRIGQRGEFWARVRAR